MTVFFARKECQPQRFRDGASLVTDRVVPVFGGCVWFRCSQAGGPMCSGAPAPTAPGRPPFRVAGADPQLTQRLLRRADRHRRVRGLGISTAAWNGGWPARPCERRCSSPSAPRASAPSPSAGRSRRRRKPRSASRRRPRRPPPGQSRSSSSACITMPPRRRHCARSPGFRWASPPPRSPSSGCCESTPPRSATGTCSASSSQAVSAARRTPTRSAVNCPGLTVGCAVPPTRC